MGRVGECVRLERKPVDRGKVVAGTFDHPRGGGGGGWLVYMGCLYMGCLDLWGSAFLLA